MPVSSETETAFSPFLPSYNWQTRGISQRRDVSQILGQIFYDTGFGNTYVTLDKNALEFSSMD
jgi:hypothetical protein